MRYNRLIDTEERHMTEAQRTKLQEAMATEILVWESTDRYEFIIELLDMLDDEALAKVAEQQVGVSVDLRVIV